MEGMTNQSKSAVEREAIEERKLAETYLQCNNMAQAQKHLAQAAQLMSLVDDVDMGLNRHNNVGIRGGPSKIKGARAWNM